MKRALNIQFKVIRLRRIVDPNSAKIIEMLQRGLDAIAADLAEKIREGRIWAVLHIFVCKERNISSTFRYPHSIQRVRMLEWTQNEVGTHVDTCTEYKLALEKVCSLRLRTSDVWSRIKSAGCS